MKLNFLLQLSKIAEKNGDLGLAYELEIKAQGGENDDV
jgi:hypothetical protein